MKENYNQWKNSLKGYSGTTSYIISVVPENSLTQVLTKKRKSVILLMYYRNRGECGLENGSANGRSMVTRGNLRPPEGDKEYV